MRIVCTAIVAALILTVARGTDNVALAWYGGNDYAGYGKHIADAMEVSPILITSNDGQASAVMAAAGDMTTYAFNIDAGFFATDGKEGYDAEDVPSSGCTEKDVKGALHDLDWNTGYGKQVLQSMATMQKVDDFWRNEVGIQGIDGKNSPFKLVILPEELGGGAQCLSAKKNSKVYSYLILLGLAPDGNTIGVYPEILCHEYTHAILSNLVQFGPGDGEHGALNEAIADIFAAAYLKDPSWHLAAGLQSYDYDRDIKGAKRTMKDYDYEGTFTTSITEWFIKIYLDARGKPDTGALDVNGNSLIVSHTVYKIWKGAYGQDFTKLTDTMSIVLSILPAKADFSDFRESFTAAARYLYGDKMAEKVEGYFDKAGIRDKGAVIYNEPKTYGNGSGSDQYSAPSPGSGQSQTTQTTVEDYRSALSGSGNLYYAMVDLNGDGLNELLATDSVYDENKAYQADIYAISGGSPTRVMASIGSSMEFLKYDLTSRTVLSIEGDSESFKWVTYYVEGTQARASFITEFAYEYDDVCCNEVVDGNFDRVFFTELGEQDFGMMVGEWQERDARATYITFEPLPF